MNHWLMKSEPDVYSIEHLSRDKVAPWDGIRNYQARNFLRAMKTGDRAFFYHSSTTPSAIVGEMEIAREAYPEPKEPAWSRVDVRFLRRYSRPLALSDIRKTPTLQGMVLLHNSRLSVQPVTSKEWATILSMVLSLLIGIAPIALAECRYFLTKVRFEKCEIISVPVSPLIESATGQELLDAEPQDNPGPDDGRRAQLSCECDYTLSGSDPRCDFDHTEPVQAIISTGSPEEVCKTARKRCREVCAPSLKR